MQASVQSAPKVVFRETVWPSPIAILPVFLAFPLFTIIFLPITDLVIATLIAATLFVAIVVAVAVLSPVIQVSIEGKETRLFVKKASIESKFIGDVIMLTGAELRSERGPLLDTRAFTCFQPSVKTMVKLTQIDLRDQTPYWLFSTRKPEELIAALKK